MESTSADHRLNIIDPSVPAPRKEDVPAASAGGGADGEGDAPAVDRIRFFGRRSFGANTWAVTLFAILHVVAFIITMFVNDCPGNAGRGHEVCTAASLGRFSFQPASENPLFGPSSPTLVAMGAIQRTPVLQGHQYWRLVTCTWLHAGVIQLAFNVFALLLIGIRLEQDYGPLRIWVIYLLSAVFGSTMSALFNDDVPAVGSTGALSGLLGAMLSGFIQNWRIYDSKGIPLVVLAMLVTASFILGLMPYVDNLANIGSFLSGVLLGLVFLFNPQLGQMERKKGLYDYNIKGSMRWEHKMDKPQRRIISLVLFFVILAGMFVLILLGTNVTRFCPWCHYIDCVPSKLWRCGAVGGPSS